MHTVTDYQTHTRSAIDDVIASFPVRFSILNSERDIFIAYYNSQHQLVVAQRPIDGDTWTSHVLPVKIEWDSHNYITMSFDNDGHIHLSANMHVDPLVYFISEKPHDIRGWQQFHNLVGEREDRCTYPAFLTHTNGDLIFHYRDGSSGDGCDIYNCFSATDRSWSRLLNQPLLDGGHAMNAYAHGPVPGPDHHYHVCWVWRDDPAADSNHDLSYAKSPDLINWFAADGSALRLPITIQAASCIVDPVPVQAGMINGNNHIGFDANNNAFLVYHKFDEGGLTQAYVARFIDGQWAHQCISAWDYRWAFGGWGSLEFEIQIHDPVHKDGSMYIPYYHAHYGDGLLVLDPLSLELQEDRHPAHLYPQDIYTLESELPTMRQNHSGAYPSPFVLQWESLPNNRDKKPDKNSELSSTLSLIEFS